MCRRCGARKHNGGIEICRGNQLIVSFRSLHLAVPFVKSYWPQKGLKVNRHSHERLSILFSPVIEMLLRST
jgi:hypothetical protein